MKCRVSKDNSSDELVEFFANSVEQYYALRDDGVISEEMYDLKSAAYSELYKRGLDSRRLLVKLLDDPRPAVRLEAAFKLSDLDPERSLQVLRALSRDYNGTIGFVADNAIDSIVGESRFNGPPPISP